MSILLIVTLFLLPSVMAGIWGVGMLQVDACDLTSPERHRRK